ncbi:MAG: hypothetical protein J7L21_05815 [Sulfurimonas sp.]|nr:hypothetical protein [Sulfurimonas sp.]
MRVGNYSVAMNAQYFNLQMESTQTSVSSSEREFTNDASEVTKIASDTSLQDDSYNKLSTELAKSVLKNINAESHKLVGDRVEISHTYVEAEALNFQTKAFVEADGKEIELALEINLSRSFIQHTRTSLTPAQLADPLVLSLDGGMPSLSSKTFAFDIDSDGKSDQISQLGANSVFLALDKNKNGTIDNGSELFGTKSGNGFGDLSKYDDDNNGWIDENDAIFDKLQIWQKNDDKSELIALGEVGIGAIFLGNTTTPFSMKSNSNELLGEIKSSGFFLYENGMAGVISQIDLAINPQTKEDLEKVDEIQKGISSLNLEKLYKDEDENGSNDKRLEKLQKLLNSLEEKLAKASDDEKPPLQAQIGAVFSQMMSLISETM